MILDENLFKDDIKRVRINLDEALELDIVDSEDSAKNGMQSIVNNLIKEELNAIQLYNDAALQCEGLGFSGFSKVFEGIASEETIHIGELQKLLDEITPKTIETIDDGHQEAEDILQDKTE